MHDSTFKLYKNKKKVPIKIQILLNKELIEELQKDEVPIKHIYEHLIELKKINCTYRAFTTYVKPFFKEINNKDDSKSEAKTLKTFVPPTPKENKFINTNGLNINLDDIA